MLAVALTSLLILVLPEASPAQTADSGLATADSVEALGTTALPDSAQAAADTALAGSAPSAARSLRPDSLAGQAAAEATGAVRTLWAGFVGALPKIIVAVLVLLLAALLTRFLRPTVEALSSRLHSGSAVVALLGTVVWVVAAGTALSVLAGDIRALVGSLGLVGLALSWSLQGPIESFTGWLLNSFKGYYRVGDRIAVGDVQGDVFDIDVLNTTVWEIGGPGSPSGIQAEQPTGRLITFPNSEIVAGTVVNYTRDFPYVWDEIAVSVAAESDLAYASEVVEGVAQRVVGDAMSGPAQAYAARLKGTPLDERVAEVPEVYLQLTDWGVNLIVRYLVEVRARRATKTALGRELVQELNKVDHAGRILSAYPRQQIQLVGPTGQTEPWHLGEL